MGRYALFPFICVLLLTAFSRAHAECGIYEEQVDCVDYCNTCNETRSCPDKPCVPGCDCIQGYSRNDLGRCVPLEFCNTDFIPFGELVLASGIEQRRSIIAFGGGCPSENACILSCEARGFKNGICLGPKKEYCNCFSLVPPEKVPTQVVADDSPAKVLDIQPCPKDPEECIKVCNKYGFKTGICVGNEKDLCLCANCNASDPDCSKPEEPPKCPSNPKSCIDFCKKHGFKTGICVGKNKDLCFCGNCTASDPDCPKENEVIPPPKCPSNPQSCIDFCKKYGFKTGNCVGAQKNLCLCTNCLPDDPNCHKEDEVIPPPKCPSNPQSCIDFCKKYGFKTGKCVGKNKQLCLCTDCNPRDPNCPKEEKEISQPVCPNYPRRCAEVCHQAGYKTGICGGRKKDVCQCIPYDDDYGDDDDYDDSPTFF